MKLQEVEEDKRPISEQFRIVALQYVEAESRSSLIEDLKSSKLAEIETRIIDAHVEFDKKGHPVKLAQSHAERLAKITDEWKEYVRGLNAARERALKLKMQLDWLRMREREQDRMYWFQRSEHKMGRSAT